MENIDVISIYGYCREENIDMLSILIFANIFIPISVYIHQVAASQRRVNQFSVRRITKCQLPVPISRHQSIWQYGC